MVKGVEGDNSGRQVVKGVEGDTPARQVAEDVKSDSSERPSVSVFYPCYNDWGTIGSMILLTTQIAERLGLDYDLTLVDDGSESQTLELLDEAERQFPALNIVHHDENRGYGAALRSGFKAATREWIFYTDGDAQYDVRELELLIEHAKPGVDVVQGYKITRHDPLHRKVIGRIYHWIVKIAFGLRLRDVDCDFRLIRRSVFDKVELTRDSGVICAELMVKIHQEGFNIVEVPVHHYPRAHGKSQFFNFVRVARVIWQLRGLWIKEVLRYRPREPKGSDDENPVS